MSVVVSGWSVRLPRCSLLVSRRLSESLAVVVVPGDSGGSLDVCGCSGYSVRG